VLERRGASEFIGMVFHGYTITHVDTPAHYFWKGRIYNGRSCNLITSREGAQVEAVELLHDGVVSRGVLLDIAALKGRWLQSGEGVMPEDLDAAEKAQGVRVEPGDILLIRTGYYGRRLEHGPRNPLKDGSPAAHVACAPWFRERGVAMLGTDTLSASGQCAPHRVPRGHGSLADRQRQPGGPGRCLSGARTLGVHADHRASAPAGDDWLAGEPDRVVLMAIRPRLANITPGGQRRRFVTGVIVVTAGVVAAVVLIAAGVSPGWLALLFVPFWFGSLGLVQAREKT